MNVFAWPRLFREVVNIFVAHRRLIWELTKREFSDRFAGSAFGAIWAFAHPLILMAIYVFVFGVIFATRMTESGSFVGYILIGLVPWLAFVDVASKSSAVIVGASSLVKQVVFPIETLPIKSTLASLLTQVIMTAVVLLYILFVDRRFAWTMLLLPVLIGIQAMAMTGVAYLFSSIGVYFRDLKDIVQVLASVGLFLSPILYKPSMAESAWPGMRYVLAVNPISHLIWCYQDVLFFGFIAHPWSWLITIALSCWILAFGYRIFEKLKHQFADVL